MEHGKLTKVSYFWQVIQNELINVWANHEKSKFVNKMKSAKYFGIMFDSTFDISHMFEVISYETVDNWKVDVKEVILECFPLKGQTTADPSDEVLEKHKINSLYNINVSPSKDSSRGRKSSNWCKFALKCRSKAEKIEKCTLLYECNYFLKPTERSWMRPQFKIFPIDINLGYETVAIIQTCDQNVMLWKNIYMNLYPVQFGLTGVKCFKMDIKTRKWAFWGRDSRWIMAKPI